MKDIFSTKYLRLAVLSALIDKMKDKPLGKTKALKLAYLAQELYDIPLNYRFVLYNYGPFSQEVMNDFENLIFHGIANITYNLDNIDIKPTKNKLPEAIEEQKQKYLNKVEQLVNDWGDFLAKDLELYSTIIFVEKEKSKNGKIYNKKELINWINEIKPKHKDNSLKAFDFLNKKHFLVNTY